jgi:hypothetical protein
MVPTIADLQKKKYNSISCDNWMDGNQQSEKSLSTTEFDNELAVHTIEKTFIFI